LFTVVLVHHQNNRAMVLMHNGFMPLNVATALSQKAALAQGGFFVFPASVFHFSPSASPLHAIAHCPVQARRSPDRQRL
jgi:hypothetical protein